ncbi:4-hydroxy-tetrahydrodipicolinate reductase [Candidatus Vidania fulgoroideae]|nr:4-hydroxy-tetrahydrodipicolinate reductase [Candidatus Vidania fulgoroideae]
MKIFIIGKGKAGKSAFSFFKEIKKKVHFFKKKSRIKKKCFLIDLSNRKKIKFILKKCYKKKIKVIIGTTGFNKNDIKKIKLFSKKIPIFICCNFNFFFWKFLEIVKEAKKLLHNKKTAILEKHSLKKKDCPSGSSLVLGKIIKPTSINSFRYSNTLGTHRVYFFDRRNEVSIEHKCKKKIGMFNTLPKFLFFLKKKRKGLFVYPK